MTGVIMLKSPDRLNLLERVIVRWQRMLVYSVDNLQDANILRR